MTTYATPAHDLRLLIESRAPTRLSCVARTRGGEYAGACPWCQGTDRFHVWIGGERPHYWCRQCGQHGDSVQFLRDYSNLSYREALQELGVDTPATYTPAPTYMTGNNPPSKKWQETGGGFCHAAMTCLWSKRGEMALAYLHGRGFEDATIQEAGLGYCPGIVMRGDQWGIAASRLVIPKGIVIPWYVGGELWKITLRLGKSSPNRYTQILGSSECLYNADTITSEKTSVLYEGVFDALSGQQLAPEFAHVATDDVQKCRSARWIVRLCLAPRVLVAYDADEAGDRESAYWTRTLPHAVRWRPWAKDVNAMLIEGQDILEWLVLGLM